MEEEEEEVTDLELQIFHNTVREHIVSSKIEIKSLKNQHIWPEKTKKKT